MVVGNNFYGGIGADLIILGSAGDQVLAGTGSETIIGGSGGDLFAFASGNAAQVTVQGFMPGQDYVSYVGFAQGEVARALSSATIIGGSEHLLLSDGTSILFVGITNLTSANFL